MSIRYFENIHNKKILICAPGAPARGGVAIHAERVAEHLKRFDNNVVIIPTRRGWRYGLWVVQCIYTALLVIWHRPDIIYYHTLFLPHAIAELHGLIWMQRLLGFKLVGIEHNPRHMYDRSSYQKKCFSYLCLQLNHIVFISKHTKKSYDDTDISVDSFSIEDSFLPPKIEMRSGMLKKYDQRLFNFIKGKERLILVSASQLKRYHGNDLYGIDQVVNAMYELKKEYTEIGLIIVLAVIGDKDLYGELVEKIEQLDLQDAIFWVHGNQELWPLFEYADLFIRPTLSDAGVSMSVQEALYFDVPVVASDIVDRGKGVVVCKTGDVTDLVAKCWFFLE